MVAADDDRHELRRMSGDRSGVEHGVGPVRVAAVVLHLLRAVGVHVEQDPVESVRRVGVFPAEVQHAAVVQSRSDTSCAPGRPSDWRRSSRRFRMM